MTATRRNRLTVEVDTKVHKLLARWAREEGRPVGNLLRRIVTAATVQREKRRHLEADA